MVNKPKQKGTAGESAVVSFLRLNGWPYAERLALQGGKDRGDVTGCPGLVWEVKAVQEYQFSAWLAETEVERDNAKADYGILVAKPRMVGATRTGQWYALMRQGAWWDLIREVKLVPGSSDIQVWHQDMSGASISTHIARNLKLALAHQADSGSTHSCVRIAPKGIKDPNMYYVVSTLEQVADLLVRAGYGRRDG